ncbi:MAG: alpha-L-arabinofuranosidase C-terminal domain-containing protein, partial [Bacteroidaceae bacterium]
WRPDLIWFDNLNSVRSCSYYVQQLYSLNRGTNVLPLTMDEQPVTGAKGQNGLFASAVYDKNNHKIIVKVVNTSDEVQPLSLTFKGLKKKVTLGDGSCTIFNSPDLDADNTLEHQFAIIPQTNAIAIKSNVLQTSIGKRTFALYSFVEK